MADTVGTGLTVWKLRSPDDLEARASMGWSPQAADLNEGYFFLASEAFFQSQRSRWFLLRGGFMDKNDRSNIVCCTLQLVMNKYC